MSRTIVRRVNDHSVFVSTLPSRGPHGLSAYQIALAYGYVGTEAAWNAAVNAERLAAEAARDLADADRIAAENAQIAAEAASDLADADRIAAEAARDLADADRVAAQASAADSLTQAGIATTQATAALGYRNDAQLLVDGASFAVAYGDLTALAQTSLIDGLTGMADGDILRVVNTRDGGWWKFHSGNMSAFVTADPYKGLWRAPSAAPTGTSGAWQRMVEKSIYDAEWWFPEVMPTSAQLQMNAAIAAITDPYATLLFPRRRILINNTINANKGFRYIGGGEACPVDGQSGAFYCITAFCSNARFDNISSGNVGGTAAGGEPGGFIFGAWFDEGNLKPNYNNSIRDCHAFNSSQGLRLGGATIGEESPTMIRSGIEEIYVSNFRTTNSYRIGIECRQSHGIEIVGGVLRVVESGIHSGLKRGIRIVGAKNVNITGTRIVTEGFIGISCELAGSDSAETRVYGAHDVTMTGVVTENCGISFDLDRASRNILINGCKGIGWNDTATTFVRILALPTAGLEAQNIKVIGNQSYNQGTFCSFDGRVIGLELINNTHISNAVLSPKFMFSGGTAADTQLIEAKVIGNRGVGNGTGTTSYALRWAAGSADTVITIDDNEFTINGATTMFSLSGTAVILQKRSDSNRKLPSTLFAQIRPPFGREFYDGTQQDAYVV